MPSKASTTMNLGLPDIPETTDPKLFQEFVRIYNAIKLLAQFTDLYTGDGTVVTQLDNAIAESGSSSSVIRYQLTELVTVIESVASSSAALSELTKLYKRYKVPSFTVVGAFGTNGKTPQVSYHLGAVVGVAPAGGVGTAAGGWDTAANRDAAIATIAAHSVAINNLQLALINNGIGVQP